MSRPEVVVVKLSGAALDDPAAHGPLWAALASLHQSLTARSGGVIVVHGGGAAVDTHLARLGIRSERIDGLRVTPEDHMPIIAGVLAGTVNKALVRSLRLASAPAAGLSLIDAGVRCHRVTPRGLDLGRVGTVDDGGCGPLLALLRAGILPVLSSIGDDDDGLLNVNADDASAGIARLMRARTLALLSDVAGVLDADGEPIATLDPAQAEALIEAGVIRAGMIAKVRAALGAAREAGCPVRIASFLDPTSIPQLGDRLGPGDRLGTEILASTAGPTATDTHAATGRRP
ncbi:MAG: acetylglutamate kinase [Phycisphaeraceae bacterium]|nr:acetylglutamate kinase [Phycisphaeraceae bacterium]